ncbi:hypothetical protein AKJ65_02455 [candidate division MSBL1 archaeon SCGC-AAA259E19]|uniref:Uncharacterized protein n=1 Tax=candidate division MSBL1 archaeon SCGC-AAA259E19 TaxID=1698264 RepID=A0A133ULM6_9EURY|nr:hypothetical protein AKJ65_02455 [candidate division MSBL1 archaeon SCGC-AAA259E19]
MIEIQGNFGRRFLKVSGGHGELDEIEEAIKKVEKIDRAEGTTSQIFNARRIAEKQHLIHASKLALEAWEKGKSFANSLRIELTCWTAALRQIDKAIDRVGVKENSKEFASLTVGKNKQKVEKVNSTINRVLEIEPDDKILKINKEKVENLKKAFDISPKQLINFSPKEAILEKIALLSLEH